MTEQTTQLDNEKLNVKKELPQIHQAISDGHVRLAELKGTTEEYMNLREVEAEERVLKVLKESREALDETSKNHTELTLYGNDLRSYAHELQGLSIDITTLFKDFNTRMKEAEEDMKKNQEIVADVLQKIKIERVQVQEDRKMLNGERHQIAEENRLLKDRREALERAFEELKRLQTNKENI